MTAETLENITKTFKYSFPTCTNEEVLFKLEVPVEIPHKGCTRELVQRVINMFHIPVYLEDELNEKLASFVSEETKTFHNDRDEQLINQLKNSEINVEALVKNWEKMFKENVIEYAEERGTSDEEVFAAAYHKLIHSPAQETILQVEKSYAKTIVECLKSRDEDIRKLTERQTEEMEEKVRLLNTFTTEEEINTLAAQHFEEQSLVAGRWGSQLDALTQTQRTHHRAWLMETLQEYQSTSTLNTPSTSPLGSFPPLSAPRPPPANPPRRALEESFTIHVGSQLKQTHNIRLLTMDVMELCTVRDEDSPSESSRRLQTCLNLYSGSLSGAVLLTDGPPERPDGQTAALVSAAATTEYHFPSVTAQLANIAKAIKEPLAERNSRVSGDGKRRAGPRCGDVFITKHSNLPEVHVIFHLYADDAKLRSGEISSRHPGVLGLRGVLRACCEHDVSALCVPLLLAHDLTEEMTHAWCMRRAELVLKCAKGLLVEAAGCAGGAPLSALTLTLPARTPPALCHALAAAARQVFS